MAQTALPKGVGYILCNRKRKAPAQLQAEINDVNINIHDNRLLTTDQKALSSVITPTDEGRRF